MKTIKFKIFAVVLASLSLSACIHDNFEKPQITPLNVGDVITFETLRQIYNDSVLSGVYPEGYKFTQDISVYCVCTMDDKSGNIYKSAYVQDGEAAINLHLTSSGGVYIGDSLCLHLKGLTLSNYQNMAQLDSVSVDNNMTKLATHCYVEPEEVTIAQIQTGAYQAKLVRLNKVEFAEASLGKTWADAVNKETVNHTLMNCAEQSILVRTSGYADFADKKIPEGRGSMVAIVSQFRNDWQLLVRNINEVDMNGLRCGTVISAQNFDEVVTGEPLNLEGWKNIALQGTQVWQGFNTNTLTAANFKPNTDENQDSWLISPLVELPTDESTSLSFTTRAAFDKGGVLKVLVSTNYDGGDNPAAATWTELPAVICDAPVSGFGEWTDSGLISLADYIGQSVYIAFQYQGTNVNTTEYYIDSFLIAL